MNKKYTTMLCLGALLLSGCGMNPLNSSKQSEASSKDSPTGAASGFSEQLSSENLASISSAADGSSNLETDGSRQDDEDDLVLTIGENGEVISSQRPSSPSSSETIDGLTYIDGILLVNKKHGVPATYAPGVNPEAESQCNALISRMLEEGLSVGWSTSNYRSYEYQSQLYNNYVASSGQAAADTFSARPGFSEHQTGLAFDLTDPYGQLLTSPAEAQWLLDHAADFGFIVRYQAGKEAITGYQAEPWHIRYIGPKAREIAASGLTLEEYLGDPGGDYISG